MKNVDCVRRNHRNSPENTHTPNRLTKYGANFTDKTWKLDLKNCTYDTPHTNTEGIKGQFSGNTSYN